VTHCGKIEEIIVLNTLDTPKVENIPEPIEQPIPKSQEHSLSHTIQPPFPKRLEMKIKQLEFDLVYELRNVCIKILLLQEIKDILIYAKTMRELCTKKPGRQKK